MKLSAASLRRVAIHEAGHVVAAYLVGRPFRYVTIIPDEASDTLGHAQFLPSPTWFNPEVATLSDSRTRKRVEQSIMTSFAGDAAEALRTGRNRWRGSERDVHAATDLAMRMSGNQEETDAYSRWLYVRTLSMLRLPWHQAAVDAVADALLEHKRLNAHHARALIVATIHQAARTGFAS